VTIETCDSQWSTLTVNITRIAQGCRFADEVIADAFTIGVTDPRKSSTITISYTGITNFGSRIYNCCNITDTRWVSLDDGTAMDDTDLSRIRTKRRRRLTSTIKVRSFATR